MRLDTNIEKLLTSDSVAEFLKSRCETQLKVTSIIMPIFSALFIITGIILLFVIKDFPLPGIMFIFSGTLFLVWFFIMRAIIKNQLNTIKKIIEKKEREKDRQKQEQV